MSPFTGNGTPLKGHDFSTSFEKYRQHRKSCRACGSGGAFTGQHCDRGRELRNAGIDETVAAERGAQP